MPSLEIGMPVYYWPPDEDKSLQHVVKTKAVIVRVHKLTVDIALWRELDKKTVIHSVSRSCVALREDADSIMDNLTVEELLKREYVGLDIYAGNGPKPTTTYPNP